MLALIPVLPLLGFLVNGLWYLVFETRGHEVERGNHHGNAAVFPGVIASLAIFGSFVVALLSFLNLQGMEAESRVLTQSIFTWMTAGEFSVDVSLRFDALSSLFCLVITGVGTLIHVYSIGYMSHDATPRKFFAYLNLFCFAMLMLVLGSSAPVMFLGWEGVGLCSYLLIGYWYDDMEKAKAGKKAFVANRVGDLGFLIGMFLLFTTFGTLEFESIRHAIAGGNVPAVATITAICLFLFVGCTGKSAQIPLYVWLPDAMAGPTPVSALIHAATMVTAGIYLVARLGFLFVLSPTALEVMAWTGGVTAFFAGTMALAQKDIKKVLAYSTVSQLGYMFLACGVGAITTGVFHVITHAFFKALLFLGAGSVIFGMHHEQDLMKMGGLKKQMPATFFTFAVGYLAICGIPPFSGFFSKDEILWKAFSSSAGSKVLWALAAGTAFMTAFYMTRLFSLAFFGKERFDSHGEHAAHESPAVMTVPLSILAVLSFAGGFMGLPHMSWLEHWLEPVIPSLPEAEGVAHSTEWVLMALSVALAVTAIALGLRMFRDLKKVEALRARNAGLHRLLENKWYVDEVYEAALLKPIVSLCRGVWRFVDVGVIDRIVVGFGRVSAWTGSTIRVLQTGSVQAYGFMFLIGIVLFLGLFFYGLV